MSTRKLALLLVLLLPSICFAETSQLPDNKTQAPTDARFMLERRTSNTTVPLVEQTSLNQEDYAWESITSNGPASGANPIIGNAKHQAYYQFEDGVKYPYFIVKQK